MVAFTKLLRISVLVILLQALPQATSHAQGADENLRIRRPPEGIPPVSFYESRNAVEEFGRWRSEYVMPAMCMMVLCHGNCSKRDDRCMITAYGDITSCMRAATIEEKLCHGHSHGKLDCCKQEPAEH